jgi:hypothetical protein
MYIYVGVSILILLYSILEEKFEDIKGVNGNPYIEEGHTGTSIQSGGVKETSFMIGP